MKQLDLHGHKHSEVPRVLEHFLYEHMKMNSNEIEVVTGNSNQMKDLVKDIVVDYGMEATEVWGNNGTLIIKMI